MSRDGVAAVARALLYEGYMLYPYRPSAVKNRQRFNFGVLYPETYSRRQGGLEPWLMQTECVVLGSPDTMVGVEVSFLHLVARTVALTSAMGAGEPVEVDRLVVGDRLYQPWQEAVERRIAVEHLRVGDLAGGTMRRAFALADSDERELISGASGGTAGVVRRRQEALTGEVEIELRPAGEARYILAVRIFNRTEPGAALERRDDILARCLVSTHTVLTVERGEFVSLTDAPDELRALVAQCRNVNTWPVLAGAPPARDTVLSAPIILYDYPAIAPESAGDLFDGTEIDEILSLRILTLSDDEKREIAQSDERARLLLERTEALGAEQMMSLHGIMRPAREGGR